MILELYSLIRKCQPLKIYSTAKNIQLLYQPYQKLKAFILKLLYYK